jgi:hypothetical protein
VVTGVSGRPISSIFLSQAVKNRLRSEMKEGIKYRAAKASDLALIQAVIL